MNKHLVVSLAALAMSFVGIGLAIMFGSVFKAISRNPNAEDKIGKYVFVAAGLIEAMGLFAFILALLSIFGQS